MAEAAAQAILDLGGADSPPVPPEVPQDVPTQQAVEVGSEPLPEAAGARPGTGGQPLTAKQESARAIKPGSAFTVASVKHWEGEGGSQTKPKNTWKRTPHTPTRGVAKNGPNKLF